MEIYWETLAAIGAATSSMELVEYVSALENLKQNGIQEGMAKGMIIAYHEVNLPEEDYSKITGKISVKL